MFKVMIEKEAKMHDVKVGKDMGAITCWAAFARADKQAVVAGQFAADKKELHFVLKALLSSGIDIVVIHHYMAHEQPRCIFALLLEKAACRSLPSW